MEAGAGTVKLVDGEPVPMTEADLAQREADAALVPPEPAPDPRAERIAAARLAAGKTTGVNRAALLALVDAIDPAA